MIHKHKTSDEGGFTILELLIVMAVGGLIMLIIFAALPTLQRNARNDNRKQDVSIILQAISKWELNNSGNIPQDGTYLNTARLSYYDKTNATAIVITPGPVGAQMPNTNTDSVKIINYQRCDSDNFGRSTPTGAGYHDIVALFGVETRAGVLGLCQDI